MKSLPIYQALGLRDPEQTFDFLVNTFSDAVRGWDYFVNWDKVFRNINTQSDSLSRWQSLVGKTNFDFEFRQLVKDHPDLVQSIPSLVVRDGSDSRSFQILVNSDGKKIRQVFDFTKPATTSEEIEKALTFVKNTGLSRLFIEGAITNVQDYILGVEAGIDSHGRKNRSGTAMEMLVHSEIENLVKKNPGWKFMSQATQTSLENEWNLTFPEPRSTRRSDFAVQADGELFLIEVNLFGGGGSKLKSVAGEFQTLADELRKKSVTLIWITDGLGWKTAIRPLHDAFKTIDYILNLELVAQGALAEAISRAH